MPVDLPARPSVRRRRPLRSRLRPPRHPLPFWLAAVFVALLTGLVVSRLLATAAAGAARYGDETTVVVVARRVEAGERLRTGDTARRPVPAGVVPDGAVRGAVEGEVATTDLHPGEVLVAARLAPPDLSPTAALLPRDTRGVSIPTGAGALGLRRGDRVDVLAGADPSTALDPLTPGTTVARGAPVVAVDDDGGAVTLAVSVEEAPRVAAALAAATVTLLLVGAGG